jgi:cell division protease FtsH
MSDKIGPVSLGEKSDLVFLGRDLGTERNYSEEVAKEVDAEVSKIMNNALKKAKEILIKYREALDKIAKTLMEKETIEREEFEKIISSFGIKPKKEKPEEAHE